MRLIHFAHRKEAQELLKRKDFKSLEIDGLDLYQSSSELLLISGEGIFETLKKVSFVSARFDLKEVINLGIAGSLNKDIEISQIYPVRTVYAYDSKPIFQSFEISDQGLDLISSFERVLNDESANTLSHFASLVDRELWGLCYALKGQKLIIHSYKLISDIAGNSTNCFDIKQMGQEYSLKLADFYEGLFLNKSQKEKEAFDLGEFEKFYMTHQQRTQLESLVLKLSLKLDMSVDEIFKTIEASRVLEDIKRPKEATGLIIQILNNKLNPFRAKTLAHLHEHTKKFKELGAQIHFDPNLEKKFFTLSMQINSQTNIDKLQEALKKLNFLDIERTLTGEIDV